MDRDLSSYRDRVQSSASTPQPQKGGFVRRLMGMTAEQRERGKVRKEHVRGMLNEQRDYVRSHERQTRELLKSFDKGQLDEFKRYGISEYEYKTKPEIARKKVELRMKRDRMRRLHDMKITYNQQWKEKEKQLKNGGASSEE